MKLPYMSAMRRKGGGWYIGGCLRDYLTWLVQGFKCALGQVMVGSSLMEIFLVYYSSDIWDLWRFWRQTLTWTSLFGRFRIFLVASKLQTPFSYSGEKEIAFSNWQKQDHQRWCDSSFFSERTSMIHSKNKNSIICSWNNLWKSLKTSNIVKESPLISWNL